MTRRVARVSMWTDWASGMESEIGVGLDPLAYSLVYSSRRRPFVPRVIVAAERPSIRTVSASATAVGVKEAVEVPGGLVRGRLGCLECEIERIEDAK